MGREIHVIQLKAGDARQVADAINRLLRRRTPARRPAASSIRVEGEPASNCLLVSAAPGDWQTVKTVIDQFVDKGVPQMVPSTHIRSAQECQGRRGGREPPPGLQQPAARQGQKNPVPVVISANERSNMILVSAAEDDQKAIAEIVKMFDVPTDEQKVDPHARHSPEGR